MLQAGTKLGVYEVVSLLGAGGMGEVYRARDTKLNRDVALKVLPEAFADDRERMARFEREARVLASLNHPSIAAIHGLEDSGTTHALVMELVEGPTLAEKIAADAADFTDEKLKIARQIAEALEYAHEKGIIHRDLKPANIKITPGGQVKLLDFGLAKALESPQDPKAKTQDIPGHDNQDPALAEALSQSPTLTMGATQAGVILGTAAYMAPEQARGKAVDRRADIWAFGVVLYEMLTGRRPFQGEDASETLAAVIKDEPDWTAIPAGIPSAIVRLLRRCLAKERKQRLADIADARLEIDEALATPGLEAIPSPGTGSRLGWILSALLFALVLAMLLPTIRHLQEEPPTAGQTPAHVTIELPPGDRLATANLPPIALSPNGHLLVYAAIRAGIQQLFVRPMDSREARPLGGTEGAEYPFFSPDGQWVGFFAGAKLKKVRAAGGAASIVCDFPTAGGADWGSDNTIVVSPGPISGLWRISAARGTPQELTRLDRSRGEVSHRWPQFLPGGKTLLFTAMSGFGWDDNQLFALQLDTGERRLVYQGGNPGRYVPTGHLVFYRAGSLAAVRFDPTRLQVADMAAETLIEGVTDSQYISGGEYCISSAGSLAYAPASPHQWERRLVWVSRSGEIEPVAAPPRAYANPSISPDGRQLAVDIPSPKREIWVYDLSRGVLTRLTSEAGGSLRPIWTPDGKRVAYTALRGGFRNLFWRAVDGAGSEERLAPDANSQTLGSFSLDGKWLAFFESNPATAADLWVLQLDGEHKRQLFLRTPSNESSPEFSPDGGWVAYRSDESGINEIYVRSFPAAGDKRQISTDGGTNPRWARSGRELFYRNGSRMMAVDISAGQSFEAGKPKVLFEGQYDLGFDVAPDGQRFLMVQPVEPAPPPTQINLVLNWFDELKRKVPVK